MSRRRILSILALGLASVLFYRWRFLLSQLWGRPRGAPREPPPAPEMTRADGKVKLLVVSGGTVAERLEAAWRALPGWPPGALAGKSVLVKPNVVSGSPAPTTTDATLVGAVVRKLREAGAAKVWVGDMSALMSMGTRYSIAASGIREAAEAAGAEVVCFDEHEWVPVKLPAGGSVSEVHVSEFVTRADLVVNVPVLKSHKWASFSCCLKNFVGATHGRYRPYRIDSSRWEEIVVEINGAYRPALNVVDAGRVMYAGGPWRGDEDPAGLLLVSSDRVAADALAVAILKTYASWPMLDGVDVWKQRQLRRAVELGLGVKGAAEVDIEVRHVAPPSAALAARIEKALSLYRS